MVQVMFAVFAAICCALSGSIAYVVLKDCRLAGVMPWAWEVPAMISVTMLIAGIACLFGAFLAPQ